MKIKRTTSDRPKLNVSEVASYCGVCAMTVYRWIKHKDIPFLLAGKSYRFDQIEIDKWLKNNNKIHPW